MLTNSDMHAPSTDRAHGRLTHGDVPFVMNHQQMKSWKYGNLANEMYVPKTCLLIGLVTLKKMKNSKCKLNVKSCQMNVIWPSVLSCPVRPVLSRPVPSVPSCPVRPVRPVPSVPSVPSRPVRPSNISLHMSLAGPTSLYINISNSRSPYVLHFKIIKVQSKIIKNLSK